MMVWPVIIAAPAHRKKIVSAMSSGLHARFSGVRSTAARFMIRVSIESVPAIRRIRNREIDHLRKFIAAMRRSLPERSEV